MKTVYFVRHGETEHNASKRFNNPDTPLSEKGRSQAIEIAERAAKLPIELIVASTLTRAQQTAEIIGERIGKKFESTELFVEWNNASRLHGMEVHHPDALKIIEDYFKNFGVPGYRIDDGDNFEDLKTRALAGLEYLEKRPEKNILVVTHAGFMWTVAACATFGPSLSAEECHGIIRGFYLMENTALTVLTYGAPQRKSIGEPALPWQLKVWNDHAHLG